MWAGMRSAPRRTSPIGLGPIPAPSRRKSVSFPRALQAERVPPLSPGAVNCCHSDRNAPQRPEQTKPWLFCLAVNKHPLLGVRFALPGAV